MKLREQDRALQAEEAARAEPGSRKACCIGQQKSWWVVEEHTRVESES